MVATANFYYHTHTLFLSLSLKGDGGDVLNELSWASGWKRWDGGALVPETPLVLPSPADSTEQACGVKILSRPSGSLETPPPKLKRDLVM